MSDNKWTYKQLLGWAIGQLPAHVKQLAGKTVKQISLELGQAMADIACDEHYSNPTSAAAEAMDRFLVTSNERGRFLLEVYQELNEPASRALLDARISAVIADILRMCRSQFPTVTEERIRVVLLEELFGAVDDDTGVVSTTTLHVRIVNRLSHERSQNVAN